MSSKSAKEQLEQEKKIRKKKALLLEPKESNANKFKYLQWLIEEDSDIVSYCKINHSLTGLILSEYATGQVAHCKKGKQTSKAALSQLKIIEFAGKVFPYNEFHVFESLFSLFENYLSIGTDTILRRAAYETLLNMYQDKQEYSSQFARYIISSMNIGSLIDLPPNQPFPSLVNEPYVPSEEPVDERSLSMEFIDKFLDRLLKKESYKTFLPIAENICALLFPSFSKTITLSCVVPSSGLGDIPTRLMEIILTDLRKLITSDIKEMFFKEEGATPFLEFILSTALNFSPETFQNGLNYFTFFYTEFVAKTNTAISYENALGSNKLLEFRRYIIQCIDIPFDHAEMNPNIRCFTSALHSRMMELLNNELDLMDDMKDLLIATLVNNINKLITCYRDDAVGSLVDTIITSYVRWRHSATAYNKLYDMLHQFYSSSGLLTQLCQKIIHVTKQIISLPTNSTPQNPNQMVRYISVEPDYIFPNDDPTFKEMIKLKPNEMFELWEGLWFMIQDTCMETAVKNCITSVRKVCELLIRYDGESKVDLMNTFGTYFLRSLSSSEEIEVKITAGLGLCDLFVRNKRYVLPAYSTFYESIVSLIPNAPYEFLLGLHDIFSLRLPGCTRMIVPLLSMLQQLPTLPEKSHENIAMKIIGLLNSLIYAEKLYPQVFPLIEFKEALGDFNYSLYYAQKHLMTLFQDSIAQETLLWGLACHLHLLVVQQKQNDLALDILKCLMSYLPTERYGCVCQIISSLARLSPPLPVPLITELHVSAFQMISTLNNQTVGSLLCALMEYLISPSVSPAIHSLDIASIMLEALTSALHMNTTTSKPHRIIAGEAAEAYIGLYISGLGTEGALLVNSTGSDVSDKSTKWFFNDNTLYSVTHPENGEDVTICVRNSVGRFEWKFTEVQVPNWKKTIEHIEVLGNVSEGDGIVVENIHSDINDVSQLIDLIPEELVWDFPTEVGNKEEFDETLKTTTKECIDMRKTLQQIPKEKIEILPPSLPEKIDVSITSPLTTGLLMTELFFIDGLAISSRLTSLPSHDKFRNLVSALDKTPARRVYPIGLIYVKKGMKNKEEILKNCEVSRRYEGFSSSLGEQTDIKKYNGFIGGMEKTGNDGVTVLYYKSSTRECVYHESVRMPSVEGNEERKWKLIGDDHVVIIWNENNEEQNQVKVEEQNNGNISSQVIIKPGICGVDTIEIQRNKDVRVFGPLLDNMVVPEDILGELTRETAFNASDNSKQRIIGDDVMLPYLQRKQMIDDIIPKNPTFSQKGYLSTISVFLDDKEPTKQEK
ncbi:Rap/Ran GTPase-activating protein, putative [Entamoeba histolytica HM-1:IMSS-B]|uniref:Rap/Ran GTPase-activating protein, putative n=4 Tax=Entamoeba histolytica TaxID=5759 RepID=C4LSV3_ENTH1|nr:Rap/Ran GTPase-activating protein, putative [Entamoeba histolytica HM-1:IMSS]EAL50296.2 Rap/Ran GTPase-activating protein, putative [Entamoeba histolytica HM-1:IMSS]EMD45246.1 Rap/Ran GTPase-activating protein, putative [Entamoeba histolytica KU27]EMH75543.1 Rap/Ran GTPase-activating protein, putative [Entamoeba histolytica HM-1:IMSS-B]GAT91522.1 rap ran GTPase-activating protein putative [Entamoeba histolytica]|eukprot:XP_655681.2 Rap/Ran GTPase-activating protein, putative [Entamoeba histolytica HM-1:IMSS]